jgi:hypothetical protein
VLGVDHQNTLSTRYRVAWELGESGDHAGALAGYRELLPDQVGVLGADHRDTLSTRYQVAYELGRTGDYLGALAVYRELLADARRFLGPADTVTKSTEYGIRNCREKVQETILSTLSIVCADPAVSPQDARAALTGLLAQAREIETSQNRYQVQVPVLRALKELAPGEGEREETLRELVRLHDDYGASDAEAEEDTAELARLQCSAR